jgi:hypothetical protein
MHHDAGEAFGAAVHDSEHVADEDYPEDEDDDEDAGGDF